MTDPVKLGVNHFSLLYIYELNVRRLLMAHLCLPLFMKGLPKICFLLASSVCLSGFPSMKLTKEQLLPNKGPLIASCQTEEALWLWLL